MKCCYFLPLIVFMLALTGCKQDLKLAAPYKEETVVYGLLNQQDNPHYIRIQKGYLLNGNAYVAAGIADSIYYPNILKVQLTAQPSGMVYKLTRIDGNTVSLPKDTGIFANTPNYLYTFTGNLDPAQTYTLQVTDTVSGNAVTAQTPLINGFTINSPAYGQAINLSNVTPYVVSWPPAQNAGVYDLTVRFSYLEYSASTNAVLKDTFIDIPVFRSMLASTTSSNTLRQAFSEQLLMTALSASLSLNNTSIYREFNVLKGMQFMFSAGGPDLASFLTSQEAQLSSIASSDILPPYTNINGGLGLFSSRYFTSVDSVGLSPQGIDSLACGSFSAGLRFKSSTGSICN